MLLNLSYPTVPKRNSVRVSQVMDHFGICHEAGERVIARDLEIPIEEGQVVLFTGPSGSGKSSLLASVTRHIEEGLSPRRYGEHRAPSNIDDSILPLGVEPALNESAPSDSVSPCFPCEPPSLIHLTQQDLGHCSLIDALPLPFEEALQLLSLCGLGEASLLLRTPQELSEGQRYRFSIALAIAQKPRWIIADEFTAVLDRTTAKVIAHNVRRLADRFGIGFLLATALDDVAKDLQPDILVRCDLDGRVTVEGLETRGEGEEPGLPTQSRKKKDPSRSTPSCGSASPPSPTGRTSLGGIIAATRLD